MIVSQNNIPIDFNGSLISFIQPPIPLVTSGLILNLDGSIYSGSGQWLDQTPNGNNGSLINGTNWLPTNGGAFNFDGADDYVLLPTNFFNHNGSIPFSVSFWFRTQFAKGTLFGQQNTITPGSAPGWVPAIYINTNGKVVTTCFWGGSSSNQSVSTQTVTDNAWYNITITYSNPNHITYLNGVQIATLNKTQNTYSATYYYFIGTGASVSWPLASSIWFQGQVGNMLFYNRAITPSEVTQNYNATKTRFGY